MSEKIEKLLKDIQSCKVGDKTGLPPSKPINSVYSGKAYNMGLNDAMMKIRMHLTEADQI